MNLNVLEQFGLSNTFKITSTVNILQSLQITELFFL